MRAVKLLPPEQRSARSEVEGPSAPNGGTCPTAGCPNSRSREKGHVCRPCLRGATAHYGPTPDPSEDMPRPGWKQRAACTGFDGPTLDRLFYPAVEDDRPLTKDDLPEETRLLCLGCPVRDDCIADDLRQAPALQLGWRANMTPAERQHLRDVLARKGRVFEAEERRTGVEYERGARQGYPLVSLASETFAVEHARKGWSAYRIAEGLERGRFVTGNGEPWAVQTVESILRRHGITPDETASVLDALDDLDSINATVEELDDMTDLEQAADAAMQDLLTATPYDIAVSAEWRDKTDRALAFHRDDEPDADEKARLNEIAAIVGDDPDDHPSTIAEEVAETIPLHEVVSWEQAAADEDDSDALEAA